MRVIVAPLTLLAVVIAWELVIRLRNYPAFILPPPSDVWTELLRSIQTPSFWSHVGVTLVEIAGGLLVGGSLALAVGYIVAKSRTLSSILSPLIVASQAIPIVAIAPLLAIWFGYGLTPKIVTSMLIVFFPVLINVAAGIRSVEPNLRDLMRSLQATRRQMFTLLEIPAALPMVLSGLKVGATLSVIGAIVGEFVNSDKGLGFLIKQGNGEYNTARTFVALIALMVIALSLYGLVTWIERRALAWKR
jgi:NitT/TauT family transport system permease protein